MLFDAPKRSSLTSHPQNMWRRHGRSRHIEPIFISLLAFTAIVTLLSLRDLDGLVTRMRTTTVLQESMAISSQQSWKSFKDQALERLPIHTAKTRKAKNELIRLRTETLLASGGHIIDRTPQHQLREENQTLCLFACIFVSANVYGNFAVRHIEGDSLIFHLYRAVCLDY